MSSSPTPPPIAAFRNRLFRENALDLLRRLPDESVDLLFTDPPYSSGGLHSASRARPAGEKYITSSGPRYPDFSHDNKDQRSWTFWCMTWLGQALRVTKRRGYLVCFIDWRQLPSLTDAVQGAGFIWQGIAVWDKTQGRARPRRGGFSHQAEYMVWATREGTAGTDVYLPGVFTERLAYPKRHMTEKPSGLAREVVRLVPPGSTVLDPFAGSGTFLVAARDAGHDWIGSEIEPDYYEVARQRLACTSPPNNKT